MSKYDKFVRTLAKKCQEENANFDKEFPQIQKFNGMNKNDYLFSLQDEQTFKNKYLLTHYKMYNLLDYLNQKIYALTQKELTEEGIQNAINELEDIKTELANSRIEIFFCNVSDNKKLIPFANATMPYGLLHVGLLIDDVIIQWGRSVLGKSIVNPSDNVIYNDYIFAIEIDNQPIWDCIKETFNNLRDYITKKKDYNSMGTLQAFRIADNQLNIIASQSVKYNVDRSYNIVLKNCQHFATSILDKLKLKVNKNGPVGNVLEKTMKVLNRFTLEYNGEEFRTRKDLDNFALIHDFSKLSKEDRRLLFCYRNVFDYYERNNPDDKNYQSSDYAKAYWNELAEKEKF